MSKDISREKLINSVKKYLSSFSARELEDKLRKRKEYIELSKIKNSEWLSYPPKVYENANEIKSTLVLAKDTRTFAWSLNNKWSDSADLISSKPNTTFKPGQIPLPEAA